jgi:AAA domain
MGTSYEHLQSSRVNHSRVLIMMVYLSQMWLNLEDLRVDVTRYGKASSFSSRANVGNHPGRGQVPAFVMMGILFCYDRVQKLVVVGDPAQLPPFASSEQHEVASTFTIVQKALQSTPEEVIFLETQHRMPSPIGEIISLTCYDGRLITATYKERDPIDCLYWYDVKGKEMGRDDASKANLEEVEAIVGLVRWLQEDYGRSDITVLTVYTHQLGHLSRAFRRPSAPENLRVGTVDSFEGREGETIVLSLVSIISVGFVDRRRANVALSRMKDEMFLVGDRTFWKTAPNEVLFHSSSSSASILIFVLLTRCIGGCQFAENHCF